MNTNPEVKAFLSEIGRAGGKAGVGEAKSRGRDPVKAVNARWTKQRAREAAEKAAQESEKAARLAAIQVALGNGGEV